MKLMRYGPIGAERPGLLDASGRVRDLSRVVDDFAGPSLSIEVLERLRGVDVESLPVADDAPGQTHRVGPCLADMPNFFCIGLNYARHAEETGAERPDEPILFSKATSALSGPYDPIWIPPGSERLDWEVELGVVIGREATRISETDALSHVAGYCLVNDVSERRYQAERGGQWIKGKSCPSFGPVGPYLVTADEVENPQSLSLWLDVNGERRQNSDTSDMIFGVAEIISYMSWFMTLRVGDLIATGTPEGVGLGMNPPRFLTDGDVVSLGIDGLGEQRQDVRETPAA